MDISVQPEIFHEFYTKIAFRLRLGNTSRQILGRFIAADASATAITQILDQNQYFGERLVGLAHALSGKEEAPTLRSAVSMLGMQVSRDHVCAAQVYRSVTDKFPPVDKDGKPEGNPLDYVTFARKALSFAEENCKNHADSAYAAGALFDIVKLIGSEIFKAGKGFDDYHQEVFTQGLASAKIGVEIVKRFHGNAFSNIIFPACLIHDIGKLAMELLYPPSKNPSYQAFRQEVAKKTPSRLLRHTMEAKRFGMSHEYYSAHMTYHHKMFRNCTRAVLFHHDPFIVKNSAKEAHLLGCVIALASNMASNTAIPKDGNDPAYKKWITPDLESYKAEPKKLIEMAKGLGQQKS